MSSSFGAAKFSGEKTSKVYVFKTGGGNCGFRRKGSGNFCMDLHCKNKTHQNKCSLPDEDKLLVRVPNKVTDVFSSLTISLVVAQD